mmetsp:Transcript_29082/g.28065  ORF Transcript_29082/g.28065 Transcript_29082/m.28065 type:complete len:113 (+) Transcript_29082:490-828(+)
MMKIISKAEIAYKQREAAKKEMNQLKEEAKKEQEEFEKEWNKLGKQIEKDKMVKDFIKTHEESKAQQAAIGQQSTAGPGESKLTNDANKANYRMQRQDNLNELTNTEKSLKK